MSSQSCRGAGHGGALPWRLRSNDIPVCWPHHGGALPLSRRHGGAMPRGWRHDGAFVRRLHHGGALLLSWRHAGAPSWRKGREGAWGGEGRRKLYDLPVSRQTRGRCLVVLVGNPSHSYHPEGFYPGARPPDIEEVHCVWQWCICPSQAAPLAQGGLDGWRAGWARPDEGGGVGWGGVGWGGVGWGGVGWGGVGWGGVGWGGVGWNGVGWGGVR